MRTYGTGTCTRASTRRACHMHRGSHRREARALQLSQRRSQRNCEMQGLRTVGKHNTSVHLPRSQKVEAARSTMFKGPRKNSLLNSTFRASESLPNPPPPPYDFPNGLKTHFPNCLCCPLCGHGAYVHYTQSWRWKQSEIRAISVDFARKSAQQARTRSSRFVFAAPWHALTVRACCNSSAKFAFSADRFE